MLRTVRDQGARALAAVLGHAWFQQGWQRYQRLSGRDQLALKVLAGFLLLVLLWQLWLLPLHQWHRDAQRHYVALLEDLRWMQTQGQNLDRTTVQQRPAGQSLLGLANQLAREQGLAVQRFEPLGETGLGLWLEQAAFDDTLLWLGELQSYGIGIEEFRAARGDHPGRVDVRVTLRE